MALFPLFLILLAAALLIAGAAALYLQIYKRRINQALASAAGKTHKWIAPSDLLMKLIILILLFSTIASYFVGYKTAYDRLEQTVSPPQAQTYDHPRTFYAEIVAISGTAESGNSVHVRGLAVNSREYRGEFTFAFFGETMIEWQGMPLDFSALAVGDTIAVTYCGDISDGSSAVIPHVICIEVLDDEKQLLP